MQLLEIMRKLSKHDLNEIEDYLDSRILNRSPHRIDVIKLFKYLITLHPDYEDKYTEKKHLYNTLFPKKTLIDGKMEKLSSELNKLLREYLVYKYFKSDEMEFERSIFLLRSFRQLELNEKYKLLSSRIQKMSILSQKNSIEHLYYEYLFQDELYKGQLMNNKMHNDLNLAATLEKFIIYFETYKLRYLNISLAQKHHTSIHFPAALNDYLNNSISKDLLDKNPLLLISYQIYQILNKKNPEINDFNYLHKILIQHENNIPAELQREAYGHLRNICTLLIDLKHDNLIPILHNIQKDNIQRGFFYYDGKIMPGSMSSITRIACLAQNPTWAMENIEKHKDLIIGDSEEKEYYRINKALCLHYQKQYNAALDELPPICDNIVFHLLARRIEIMCYYDLTSDLLLSKIDAFKVYIRRAYDKGLADTLLDPNKEFVNVIMQIIGTSPGDKNRCLRLLERLDLKGQVAESKWLIAKIKELG